MDDDLTRSVWNVDPDEFPADASADERARFLLRYAILAPSSHNSQPWRFDVRGDAVEVTADETRWLEAADPDRRELYVSLGCCVENLRIAAERFGFDPVVEYREGDRAGDGLAVVVTLDPGPDDAVPADRSTPPFDEITERYTSHRPFEDRPLDPAAVERIREAVGNDIDDDVALVLVDDPDRKRSVGALQAEADEAQMDDPEYRKELGHWVGIGALGDSWLAARVGQLVVTHLDLGEREGRKNSRLVDGAPAVGVLVTDADDAAARVRTGRAFERLALAASAEGVAVHPMSQTLERPATRERLADLLDVEGHPQHLFRLGYVDEAPEHTPRWPVEAFLRGSG